MHRTRARRTRPWSVPWSCSGTLSSPRGRRWTGAAVAPCRTPTGTSTKCRWGSAAARGSGHAAWGTSAPRWECRCRRWRAPTRWSRRGTSSCSSQQTPRQRWTWPRRSSRGWRRGTSVTTGSGAPEPLGSPRSPSLLLQVSRSRCVRANETQVWMESTGGKLSVSGLGLSCKWGQVKIQLRTRKLNTQHTTELQSTSTCCLPHSWCYLLTDWGGALASDCLQHVLSFSLTHTHSL